MSRRVVVDLFAGAGGASTGALQACQALGAEVEFVAVNHWDVAIATHSTNHPEARHYCTPVEALDPREAVPGGRVDVLIAAPECTHHSTARGGRPINDQSRASAWHVLRWLELLRVESVLIENVPEFRSWGPIGADDRPLKSRKGETFRAFLGAIESLNYQVDYRILNAADYGEATTRRRLFIQARRRQTGGPIVWPEPTHGDDADRSLLREVEKWRPAREVIDWSLPSQSIFRRKRPLADKTLHRIAAGARRFWGMELEPFLMYLTHSGRTRSVDQPFPTITAANRGELALVEPFIVPFLGEREGQDPRVRSVDDPLQTVTSSNPIGLCEPFVITPGGADLRGGRSVDDPLPTVMTYDRLAVVEPFVLQQQSGGVPRRVGEPLPTVAAKGAVSLIEPFLVQDNGTGEARRVDASLPTITTRDRCGLVEGAGEGAALDIRFRMLQPHELAAAMGFPEDYEFTGTKTDRVKQIGNAISVRTMRALVAAVLDPAA